MRQKNVLSGRNLVLFMDKTILLLRMLNACPPRTPSLWLLKKPEGGWHALHGTGPQRLGRAAKAWYPKVQEP